MTEEEILRVLGREGRKSIPIRAWISLVKKLKKMPYPYSK